MGEPLTVAATVATVIMARVRMLSILVGWVTGIGVVEGVRERPNLFLYVPLTEKKGLGLLKRNQNHFGFTEQSNNAPT